MEKVSAASYPPAPASDAAPQLLDCSVIVVNYNVREFLEQALRSVQRAASGLNVEVFVVDNNSVDGSVEMVRERFPEVRLIANEENVGFGIANNQAIRQAQGRYLFILNPDTIVQEDTLATLIRFMAAHPEAGAVGCKILNPDGTFALESRRAFPTPRVAFFRMIGLSRLLPHSRLFGRYNLTYLPVDEVAEVDALSGSCMFVRREALDLSPEEARERRHAAGWGDGSTPAATVGDDEPPASGHGAGLFDEEFFMYGEDLDWCYRIQQAGWKIYYTPETQIIHYKGESTKKGELRYVRFFYGAMLHFARKHFHNRYSSLFVWLLRLGVFARASLTVLANTGRRLAGMTLDLVLVFTVVAVLGSLRQMQTGVDFSPLFYLMVAPGYALCTIAGIAATGGYRLQRRYRTGPVWFGLLAALLIVSAASFFVRDIAFSRAVVLVSLPLAGLLLSGWRLLQRSQRTGPRRALLVGHALEARRLRRMLSGHPQPPFQLIGYVDDDTSTTDVQAQQAADLPRLGSLRHLRDLVRLRRIDDVVFAADGISNRTIFRLMQQLRDLPVQSRILAEGREHVIGKAAVDDLSTPTLIEAEKALGTPRSRAARRAFEMAIALLGLLVHPLAAVVARLGDAGSYAHRLAAKTRRLPAVFAGRIALIGYSPDDAFTPPPEWSLHPGLFAVTDTLATPRPTAKEASQAYWFYVRNQSAFLDWTILVRALRRL